MQVERRVDNFEPINVVLQSQEEVDCLYEITRHVSGLGETRNFFDNLGNSLREFTKFHTDYYTEHFDSKSSSVRVK